MFCSALHLIFARIDNTYYDIEDLIVDIINSTTINRGCQVGLKYTQTQIIERFNNIHKCYDYSKVKYIGITKKVCIICPLHGEFWMRPYDHINNHGCSTCGGISANKKRLKKEKLTFNADGKSAFDVRYEKIHKIRRKRNNYASARFKGMATMKANNTYDKWRENWYSSMVENGTFLNPKHLKQFKKFKRKVYQQTRKNLKHDGKYVGYYPLIYQEEGKVIDHKYSIKEGFINQVPLSILSHVCNIEMISFSDNAKKGAKCSQTMEELIESIQNFKKDNPTR